MSKQSFKEILVNELAKKGRVVTISKKLHLRAVEETNKDMKEVSENFIKMNAVSNKSASKMILDRTSIIYL